MNASGTSTIERNVRSNSTSRWDNVAPKVLTKSIEPLLEVGNRGLSLDTRQDVRLPQSAKVLQAGRATGVIGRNFHQLSHFKVLESWVGKVTEVEECGFSALVISDKHDTNETAEFSFDEISDDDQILVRVGAIFYWSIGYQISEFGGRVTASTLRFQRVHHWTRKEIDRASTRAAQYSNWFLGK